MSSRIGNVQFFSIALPRYVVLPMFFRSAILQSETYNQPFEKSQDLNVLSVAVLKQRFTRELGKALSRMLTGSGQNKEISINLNGTGALQFYSVQSLR